MKNLLIYILGIFTGLVVIFFIGLHGRNEITMDNPYNLKDINDNQPQMRLLLYA